MLLRYLFQLEKRREIEGSFSLDENLRGRKLNSLPFWLFQMISYDHHLTHLMQSSSSY